MKIQRKMHVVITLLVAGIALAIWGQASSRGLMTGFGVVLIVSGLITEFAVKRCPFCSAYLGRYYSPGNYCPECGKKID